MKCNMIMASFVKKTLKKSHAALVERLKVKAQLATAAAAKAKSLQSNESSPSTTTIHSDNSLKWTSSASEASTASPSSSHSPIPLALQPGRTSLAPPPPYLPTISAPQPAASQWRHSQYPRPASIALPLQQPSYAQSRPQRKSEQTPNQPSSVAETYSSHASLHIDTGVLNPGPYPYPKPLRLPRQDSCASVYSNDNGRWQTLKQMPSVRYREGHPDYPQMNPYASPEKSNHARSSSVPETPADMRASHNAPSMAELE